MTSAIQLLAAREDEKVETISVTIPNRIIKLTDQNVTDLKKRFPRVNRSSYTAAALTHYNESLSQEAN